MGIGNWELGIGEWGMGNGEMLPVPMLPMANGAGAARRDGSPHQAAATERGPPMLRARRPAGDLRAWKPATPNVGGHTECGRAVDEAVAALSVGDCVGQLALRRKVAGDVLIV